MTAPTLTADALIALVGALTDEQHAALRLVLKARKTPEQIAAAEAFVGKGFACSATPKCSRTGFRTAGRASKHGVDDGGHTPASA